MDTAATSALSTNGADDVPIDGLPAGGRGVVQTKTAPDGLRLVCPLSETNSGLKVDSRTRSGCCGRDDIPNAVRGSSSPYWAGSRQRRWKVNREGLSRRLFLTNLMQFNCKESQWTTTINRNAEIEDQWETKTMRRRLAIKKRLRRNRLARAFIVRLKCGMPITQSQVQSSAAPSNLF